MYLHRYELTAPKGSGVSAAPAIIATSMLDVDKLEEPRLVSDVLNEHAADRQALDTFVAANADRVQIATVPVDKTAARHEIFYIKPESDDAKVKRLEQTARELRAKKAETDAYISALHRYNDMKDAGQMLLGKMAEYEGVANRSLYDRYGLDPDED
ncbi:DNA repair protein SWI5 like protein [Plasmodiophora brassicae]